MNAFNGSTDWLTTRGEGAVEEAALRSPEDLAGLMPQRPKTQPPTFFLMPGESPELEDLMERVSVFGLVPMLERR